MFLCLLLSYDSVSASIRSTASWRLFFSSFPRLGVVQYSAFESRLQAIPTSNLTIVDCMKGVHAAHHLMSVLAIFVSLVPVTLAYIYPGSCPIITKAAVAQRLEHHSRSLPALDTGLPIGYRGTGMSSTGHEGEDSGFESPQLRFSFWSRCFYSCI